MEAKCGNCKFWHKQGVSGAGAMGMCRRYPPTSVLIGMQPAALAGQAPQAVTQAVFPMMIDKADCGEHRFRIEVSA